MSSDYEAPTVVELGDVESVTEGGPGSRVDANSGNVGNHGNGKGGVEKP